MSANAVPMDRPATSKSCWSGGVDIERRMYLKAEQFTPTKEYRTDASNVTRPRSTAQAHGNAFDARDAFLDKLVIGGCAPDARLRCGAIGNSLLYLRRQRDSRALGRGSGPGTELAIVGGGL